ncbi:hypothetical protein [Dipodfec virus UOA04_Rod_592]|nr:hypothetical protein [Dipodfec virus UOA04_Rod_592]
MFSTIRRYPLCTDGCCDDALPDPHLAITPREIQELTARGVSASSSNAGLTFSEGVSDPVLYLENTRGIDPADVWNASKTAAANLVKAHKKDKDYYG